MSMKAAVEITPLLEEKLGTRVTLTSTTHENANMTFGWQSLLEGTFCREMVPNCWFAYKIKTQFLSNCAACMLRGEWWAPPDGMPKWVRTSETYLSNQTSSLPLRVHRNLPYMEGVVCKTTNSRPKRHVQLKDNSRVLQGVIRFEGRSKCILHWWTKIRQRRPSKLVCTDSLKSTSKWISRAPKQLTKGIVETLKESRRCLLYTTPEAMSCKLDLFKNRKRCKQKSTTNKDLCYPLLVRLQSKSEYLWHIGIFPSPRTQTMPATQSPTSTIAHSTLQIGFGHPWHHNPQVHHPIRRFNLKPNHPSIYF